MKINENGDYVLDDGTVIPKDQVSKLYKKLPNSNPAKNQEKNELAEGQCSGPVPLND